MCFRDCLYNPLVNKGTSFNAEERKNLKIEGMLPFHISTIEEQAQGIYTQFCQKIDSLDKYSLLSELYHVNETLFYRFCMEHIEEVLPYIYTPAVGRQCSSFFNQNRGIYLSYLHKDRMEQIVESIPRECVKVIVITDGERILGLGDLGIGGMVISMGKSILHTLFGGIHPACVLPVVLDVGTNNLSLLRDPFYLGWRHQRIKGQEYDQFVETFVGAITQRFPNVLIQWEDFAKLNAQMLLSRYRDKICCFNDDIQGTASVVLAGIRAALQSIGTCFNDQRIIIFGAGSAGIGIAELIKKSMEEEGMSDENISNAIYIFGKKGLAHTGSKWLDPFQRNFAQKQKNLRTWKVENKEFITLLETVKWIKPTILIGTSAQPNAFSQEVIEEMIKYAPQPIIFPLSNPRTKAEAVPENLIKWTNGKALIATGSPFPSIKYNGKNYVIGQCNNLLVFPGISLGVVAVAARYVTDEMFLVAAKVLSQYAPILDHLSLNESLFPPITQLRSICRDIAIHVAEQAVNNQGAFLSKREIQKAVDDMIWNPQYVNIKESQISR